MRKYNQTKLFLFPARKKFELHFKKFSVVTSTNGMFVYIFGCSVGKAQTGAHTIKAYPMCCNNNIYPHEANIGVCFAARTATQTVLLSPVNFFTASWAFHTTCYGDFIPLLLEQTPNYYKTNRLSYHSSLYVKIYFEQKNKLQSQVFIVVVAISCSTGVKAL